jgi:hypothetical protein
LPTLVQNPLGANVNGNPTGLISHQYIVWVVDRQPKQKKVAGHQPKQILLTGQANRVGKSTNWLIKLTSMLLLDSLLSLLFFCLKLKLQ